MLQRAIRHLPVTPLGQTSSTRFWLSSWIVFTDGGGQANRPGSSRHSTNLRLLQTPPQAQFTVLLQGKHLHKCASTFPGTPSPQGAPEGTQQPAACQQSPTRTPIAVERQGRPRRFLCSCFFGGKPRATAPLPLPPPAPCPQDGRGPELPPFSAAAASAEPTCPVPERTSCPERSNSTGQGLPAGPKGKYFPALRAPVAQRSSQPLPPQPGPPCSRRTLPQPRLGHGAPGTGRGPQLGRSGCVLIPPRSRTVSSGSMSMRNVCCCRVFRVICMAAVAAGRPAPRIAVRHGTAGRVEAERRRAVASRPRAGAAAPGTERAEGSGCEE